MFWKIEIQDKPGIFDAVGEGVKKDILDLGIRAVKDVAFAQVYSLSGDVPQADIVRICQDLLSDPVSQEYRIVDPAHVPALPKNTFVVEVAYNPGVMDPVEESVLKGVRDLGLQGISSVRTSKKYVLRGKLTPAQLATITEKLLYNKLIQHIVGAQEHRSARAQEAGYEFRLISVDLLKATDAKLKQISARGQLFLNLTEMRAIQAYFRKKRRNPTDCELETIAQTWSEHCGHKTFRGKIDYTEYVGAQGRKGARAQAKKKRIKIDNLLKSTIMKVTQELDKPWCVSVFKDNSGVIRFDEENNVCFKVETHNHPSALEPFGGANTGIGGVIRDPLGTGLGAKPFLNTDVFCFAPPDYPFAKLPKGSLHPKRIAKGVVSGVRDYGNKMGIPTVNGAVLFHEGFVGNPLVYCGTAGIMPKEKSFKQASAGELIVVVGGRTGRDGIHGATFSSGELTHESETISSGAVQIGNPIQEKKMVDAIIAARDANLYTCITDCGAGGLSSAVGEMGAELGCRVDLDKVPLKYRGLSYTEIWISESQERMVLAVARPTLARLLELFAQENVEAAVIGELTDTRRLELFYQGNRVCDLAMEFLHDGLPRAEKKAVFCAGSFPEPAIPAKKDLTPYLERLLSHYDICSKEWVVRQYDHEVQGGSVLKPLVGAFNDGPSDAAICRPVLDSSRGVIVSCGINFNFGFIDPYWMAASCIDESLRQIISVGGSLERVALLDNFCWGNPDKPDRLGSLVRAAYGCYDIAKAFGVPFISGKDSLYNEYAVHGRSTAIPGTLLISAMAVMEDVSKAVSMYAKRPGDLVYAVGMTYPELGGSHYYGLFDAIGKSLPRVRAPEALRTFQALSAASRQGLVTAMHDCSEGGIGVAAAEMAFAGNRGMELFLKEVPFASEHKNIPHRRDAGTIPMVPGTRAQEHKQRDDVVLFSESNSRFLVEVAPENKEAFERGLAGVAFGCIGCVSENKDLTVYGVSGKKCVRAAIADLREAWKKPLRW